MIKRILCSVCAVFLLSVSCLAVDDMEYYSMPGLKAMAIDTLYVNSLSLAEETVGALGDSLSNCSFVRGQAPSFGVGYLYLPKSAKDSFGISAGHLVNSSSSAVSGTFITDSGYSYSVSYSSMSTGRARLNNQTSTIDFNLAPVLTDTNMTLTDNNQSPFTNMTELLLFIVCLLLGVKAFA